MPKSQFVENVHHETQNDLTAFGMAVTLRKMMKPPMKIFRRAMESKRGQAGPQGLSKRRSGTLSLRSKRGQTTVEYLLTTLVLVVAFAGFYGFIQQQLKSLFTSAAGMILATWV